MLYVTTPDKTQLYVKDWGTGRPVILLHGWPLSSDSWEDQAVAIADAGFRVIAYDRRGFGRSSQPWRGYDYDSLADDLSVVIEHMDAKNAVLVGFSMGGGEVARYMSRHGGRHIIKTVLISSVTPYMMKTTDNPDGVEPDLFEKMARDIKEDRAKFFSEFFKEFFGVGLFSKSISQQRLERVRTIAMQASLKATLECAKSFATTDFRADLSAFNVPTLIIHGTNDKTVPIDATGRAAAKLISQSVLMEYDDAPHGVFATHKEQLTRDLIDFLQR
jgi:non-heme chloroperoxidase